MLQVHGLVDPTDPGLLQGWPHHPLGVSCHPRLSLDSGPAPNPRQPPSYLPPLPFRINLLRLLSVPTVSCSPALSSTR